jgi:hypothetical protein
VNTVKEPTRPVKSARDRWHVRADWRSLIDALNEDLALLEDLLSLLEVSFKQFKQSDLLPLQLVQNDRSVQEAFKRIEQLELANNCITIVK